MSEITSATRPDTIRITVNGEARHVPQGAGLVALLAEFGLDTRKVAVERNEEIVPRSAYATTRLEAGDSLEIVHFIGGG
ncbi:MAG: thiamine biosynthesis protein ThiS [Azospirillum brasilense]|nr:MAG: thiamine biosynthesis protein ThiS [Azospirillum brasilense]